MEKKVTIDLWAARNEGLGFIPGLYSSRPTSRKDSATRLWYWKGNDITIREISRELGKLVEYENSPKKVRMTLEIVED